MSIPDNPFQHFSPSPPVLTLDTGDHVASPQISVSPPVDITPADDSQPHRDAPRGTPSGATPAGTSGSKTPRRVQWNTDSHIIAMQPIPPVPSSPTTLDDTNIDQVRDALERHRASSKSQSRRPYSALSAASSGDSGDETRRGSDEDYDYRLDVDPPLNSLERKTSAGSVRSVREDKNLRDILDNGVNQHVTQYIGMGETDGLPNITHADTTGGLAKAENLVRAHTGKWGVLRRRVKGANTVTRALTDKPPRSDDTERAASTGQDAFAARYPEADDPVERLTHRHMGHSAMPPIPNGASVLSSLLALYGQQNLQSGTTSAASSRPTSEDGSSDEEEQRRLKLEGGDDRQKGDRSGNKTGSASHEYIASPAEVALQNERGGSLSPGLPSHHRSKSASSLFEPPMASPGFMGMIQKARDQLQEKARPRAARSGGGVFGALIQNTGNLSGVATPTGSTLAPAAKRPGYQLSRYSMTDHDAVEMSHPWRPSSQGNSRPTSVHSSTAVSTHGDSPKDPGDHAQLPKTFSSDDMLNMRGEKKRPKHLTMDSLGKFPVRALKEGGQALKQTEKWILSGGKTPLGTPPEKSMGEYFTRPMTQDERKRREWEGEKKRRKKAKEARKKQEIFVRDTGIWR